MSMVVRFIPLCWDDSWFWFCCFSLSVAGGLEMQSWV